jgi:hypothetical protein
MEVLDPALENAASKISLPKLPASCCLSTFTICASMNFVFFIGVGFKISNSFGFPTAPCGLVNSNFKWPIFGGAYNVKFVESD